MENVMAIDANAIEAAPKRTRRKATPKTRKATRPSGPRFSVPVNELGIVDQISVTFRKENAMAALLGSWLGGLVPMGVFWTAHYSVTETLHVSGHEISGAWLWILVFAGLIFSATTVYKWGCAAFNSGPKAFGFVVLVEGMLTFSPEPALSYVALATLVVINAVANACNLVAQRKENRKRK